MTSNDANLTRNQENSLNKLRKDAPGGENHRKSPVHSNGIVKVRAPGRICLLGEHQDYLGLEVISGAMNLAVYFDAQEVRSPQFQPGVFQINLTQTGVQRQLSTGKSLPKPVDRDYLLSGLSIMLRKGLKFSRSFQITVTGDLPIGKGVSSSSALCVGWITLLNSLSDQPLSLTPLEIAHLAFQTEVLEFNEPGGMQDHIASAVGGLLHLDFGDQPDRIPQITPLSPLPKDFLLVDSGETKETIGMIARIRSSVEKQANQIWPGESQHLSTGQIEIVRKFQQQMYQNNKIHTAIDGRVTDSYRELLATLENRDQVRGALTSWTDDPDGFSQRLAHYINDHHRQLTQGINSSSPTIDMLIQKALNAGAAAGKAIGSGGGGCLLIYAPGTMDRVTDALHHAGAITWPIGIGPGVSVM